MIEVGQVVIGTVDQVGERVRLVTEALQSARWPLPIMTSSCPCDSPTGHETGPHRADPDGRVLLPQTPAVRGCGRPTEARPAAVAEYRGDGRQPRRYLALLPEAAAGPSASLKTHHDTSSLGIPGPLSCT